MIVLFGPPGCGKGTQANLICKELNLINLSVGSSVRKFVHDNQISDSPDFDRAEKIKAMLNSGELLDFEDVKYIIEGDIKQYISEHRNILIEGLPRTKEQADWLANFFESNGVEVLFFHFVLDEDRVLERLSHRYYVPGNEVPYASYEKALAACPEGVTPTQRKDDMQEDIIRHRYDVQYASCKEGIISTMSTPKDIKVIEIDASPAPDFIFGELSEIIHNHSKTF
ncbi:MAG: adenylate kinase [Patescibacteria group bacterium]